VAVLAGLDAGVLVEHRERRQGPRRDERQPGDGDEDRDQGEDPQPGPSGALKAACLVMDRPGGRLHAARRAHPTAAAANLTALDVTLDDAQRARLDAVSVPELEFPAPYLAHAPILQFAGATVDGVAHLPNPPLADNLTRY
jgi:hypothetical protein